MVGSGLYVLVGTVAKNTAGPSIVISYVLAAVASILSATCYAGITLKPVKKLKLILYELNLLITYYNNAVRFTYF